MVYNNTTRAVRNRIRFDLCDRQRRANNKCTSQYSPVTRILGFLLMFAAANVNVDGVRGKTRRPSQNCIATDSESEYRRDYPTGRCDRTMFAWKNNVYARFSTPQSRRNDIDTVIKQFGSEVESLSSSMCPCA